MLNLSEIFQGVNLDDLLYQKSPRSLLNLYNPDDDLSLDEQNLPEFLPRTHPQTGAALSQDARAEWCLKLLGSEWAPDPQTILDACQTSEERKRKLSDLVIALLYIKYAMDRQFLPTPEQL